MREKRLKDSLQILQLFSWMWCLNVYSLNWSLRSHELIASFSSSILTSPCLRSRLAFNLTRFSLASFITVSGFGPTVRITCLRGARFDFEPIFYTSSADRLTYVSRAKFLINLVSLGDTGDDRPVRGGGSYEWVKFPNSKSSSLPSIWKQAKLIFDLINLWSTHCSYADLVGGISLLGHALG